MVSVDPICMGYDEMNITMSQQERYSRMQRLQTPVSAVVIMIKMHHCMIQKTASGTLLVSPTI